jgi:hypothetical protein
MTSTVTARENHWFTNLQKSQNQIDSVKLPVKCGWIHNATERQSRAEASSETTAKVIGSFCGASDAPRNVGLVSNKDFTIGIYNQKKFAQRECKPYMDPRVAQSVERNGTESMGSLLEASKRRSESVFRQVPPPLEWKPASLKTLKSNTAARLLGENFHDNIRVYIHNIYMHTYIRG